MYHFSFIILHYASYKDTIACIQSIKDNVSYPNYSIIVVDNKSPDNSGALIKEKYVNDQVIQFIFSDKNLGFAKGNNLEFQYAKYKLKSDFIALINNDTYIEQKDFIQRIISRWNYKAFDILGPDIINPVNNKHQNPQPVYLTSKRSLRKSILLNTFFLILNRLHVERLWIKITFWKKQLFPKPLLTIVNHRNDVNNELEREGVKLHGSCIIFSPNFIRKFEGLYPGTFLYMEEDILYFICQNQNIHLLYYPEVKIFHKNDQSLNEIFEEDYLKRRFYYYNHIKSARVFLHLMNLREFNF